MENEQGDEPGELVALVGAPNVGKSVIFNELGKGYADVSNYPGTTIDTEIVETREYRITDTPGVHGVSEMNKEERVTREILEEVDKVINVVDATSLERGLFLTLQLLDLGIPTVVAVNMMDEAEGQEIDIDLEQLEKELGVPVVPMVAVEGEGFRQLEEELGNADSTDSTPVERFYEGKDDRFRAVLEAESDSEKGERIYRERRERADEIVEKVVSRNQDVSGNPLDKYLLKPVTGVPITLGLLGLIYFLIGDLVAQRLVDLLEAFLANNYVPPVENFVASNLPESPFFGFIQFLLVNDNLGLLTVTVQYLVGVLLPLVIAFYLVLGVLEDSGILGRIAVLTDRSFTRIGLNGRAVIPMIVGIGCTSMGIITTKLMGTRRERIIATGLLGLTIPCSAQLGVIMGLLSGMGMLWWFGYVIVLALVFGISGRFLDQVLPGESEGLFTEIPKMRVPRAKNVLKKTRRNTEVFLREAGPLFVFASLLISILDYFGGLSSLQELLQPLTGLIGLPQEFSSILVLGVIRRDFAAAGMTDIALSNAQMFTGLVVITLFVPCIISMIMIAKERGMKTGFLMWLGSWLVAFSVGGIIAGVLGI